MHGHRERAWDSDRVGRGYVPDGSWFGLWFADRTRSPSAQRLRIRRGCRGRSPDLRADAWASRTGMRLGSRRSGLRPRRLLLRLLVRGSHPCVGLRRAVSGGAWVSGRSEEHTSELQSLMRISYAVFCLKKKNKKINQTTINNSIQHEINQDYHQHSEQIPQW